MDEIKNTEVVKKRWAKIINKNKEGLIIVPPHDKNTSIPTVSLTWDQFNSNFDFDEKDKTKCYLKESSEFIKTFAELPITKREVKSEEINKPVKKNFKKNPKKSFKKDDKKTKEEFDKNLGKFLYEKYSEDDLKKGYVPVLSEDKELRNDVEKAIKEVKPLVDKAIKETVELEEKGTKFVSTTKLEIARTLKKLPKKQKIEKKQTFDKEYTMSIGDMLKAKK